MQSGEASQEVVSRRELVQVGPADRVLGVDPPPGLCAVDVLQPAVGIGDLGAVVVVDDIALAGVRVVRGRGVGECGRVR